MSLGIAPGRITLSVSDFDRSLPFYRSVPEPHVLRRHAGLHRRALRVRTIDGVRAIEATLRAQGQVPRNDGVAPQREAAEAAVCFTDPAGLRLEICCSTGAAGLAAPVAGGPFRGVSL